MDEPANRDTVSSILYRDPAGSILFGFSLFLIAFVSVAGVIFARTGHAELLRAALLLTLAFAAVGAVYGLVRGLQSAGATNRRSSTRRPLPPP